MTDDSWNDNEWSPEADTQVRRSLLEDDELAKILDGSVFHESPAGPPAEEPPSEEPPKRRRWVLMGLVLLVLIGVSFVLGVLYSQNTQLKGESSKLVNEKGALDNKVDALGGTVAQCREELTLCAEDVDLLQELGDYELNPKERYGEGYDELKKLQVKRDNLEEERHLLQAEIEKKVSNLWRPSKQPRKFWVEFKRTIREKRKVTRKLKRVDRKYQATLADMDKAFYEKKVQFKERLKEKNTTRREVAASLETVPVGTPSPKDSPPNVPVSPDQTPPEGVSPDTPKQDLASMVP